jgi:hypothetical protein
VLRLSIIGLNCAQIGPNLTLFNSRLTLVAELDFIPTLAPFGIYISEEFGNLVPCFLRSASTRGYEGYLTFRVSKAADLQSLY